MIGFGFVVIFFFVNEIESSLLVTGKITLFSASVFVRRQPPRTFDLFSIIIYFFPLDVFVVRAVAVCLQSKYSLIIFDYRVKFISLIDVCIQFRVCKKRHTHKKCVLISTSMLRVFFFVLLSFAISLICITSLVLW